MSRDAVSWELGKRRPLRGRELSLEAIEKAIENFALAIIEGFAGVQVPELCLQKNRRKDRLRAVECAV